MVCRFLRWQPSVQPLRFAHPKFMHQTTVNILTFINACTCILNVSICGEIVGNWCTQSEIEDVSAFERERGAAWLHATKNCASNIAGGVYRACIFGHAAIREIMLLKLHNRVEMKTNFEGTSEKVPQVRLTSFSMELMSGCVNRRGVLTACTGKDL